MFNDKLLILFHLWQEYCDDADEWQQRTDLEDELDARSISHPSEEGTAKTCYAKRESIEQSSHNTRMFRHQIGGIHQNGREGRCNDETDEDG